MPATNTSLRQPPANKFENYVFTRINDASAGLTSITDCAFKPCSPGSFAGDPGAPVTDDGISVLIPIGFDFEFDGMTYKNFVACSNGWMALTDPTTGTFSYAEILINSNSIWLNANIKPTFSSNAVLLAPWFDDLKNLANNVYQLGGTATYDLRIAYGLQPPPASLNQIAYGVRYHNDSDSLNGRRLIVRWTSLNNYTIAASSVLTFEVVIYENGNIEFRYVAKQSLGQLSTIGGATVGIFMPRGTNRFRDLSTGLGYRDSQRKQYKYGGYVYNASYTDTKVYEGPLTANYTVNLQPSTNWPGLSKFGATMLFQRPALRRKILPRVESQKLGSRITYPSVARTGDERLGTYLSLFDDRKSAAFVSGCVINYPTTLPRFFGGSDPGIAARQDLFTGDFEFTASVVKTVADDFIAFSAQDQLEPFNDSKRFEQDPANVGTQFFATGSSVDIFGEALQQPLRDKTQIRLSFPVNYGVQMMQNSSSIMYYNVATKSWVFPQNSQYVIASDGTIPANPKNDVCNVIPDMLAGRIVEDQRGFGPIGNSISSGSVNRSGQIQTDPSIGALYTTANAFTAVQTVFPKSVSNNPDYTPVNSEMFNLPINQPFLIEKAVFEIPVAAGDGWFKNMTTNFLPLDASLSYGTSGFDFAGPGIIVALFNRIKIGSATRLDLIMTGTITHKLDNTSQVIVANFPDIISYSNYEVRPQGFAAYNATPAGIITPASSSTGGYQFTGSLVANCVAGTSNGVVLKCVVDTSGVPPAPAFAGQIARNIFSAPSLPLKNLSTNLGGPYGSWYLNYDIAYISAMGRGSTGFEPSGRSVFGREISMATSNFVNGYIPNPFYIEGSVASNTGSASGLPAQIEQALEQSFAFFQFSAAIPFISNQPSPYLVFPGDELVLAVSKTRPFCFSSQTHNAASGSLVDDFQLLTGAINITLYGSQLQENYEFHDTQNQTLACDNCHEIIGADTVLDQFEVEYRETYIGGLNDNYVTGTLIQKNVNSAGQASISTGARGRILSKQNARNVAPTTTTNQENITNTSKAFRLEQWWERVGNMRTNVFINQSERFYDSMMPSVADCFVADGCSIFVSNSPPPPTWVNAQKIVTVGQGYIFFDYDFSDTSAYNNPNWTYSYPFEPRYSQASRQLDISKSFVASQAMASLGVFTPISPMLVNGLNIGEFGAWPTYDKINWFSDVNIAYTNSYGYYNTGSMSTDDTSRLLFGFGDRNTIMFLGSIQIGTNHYPDFRSNVIYDDRGNSYTFSPLIRGWKYGVYSGLPAHTTACYRSGRFGQMRDMLEQRLDSKFYHTPDAVLEPGEVSYTTQAVAQVRFVDASGRITKPENTWSLNLSYEVTSSMPYFDGLAVSRATPTVNTLNTNVISLTQNAFGDVTI